jgi:hypothetical protein
MRKLLNTSTTILFVAVLQLATAASADVSTTPRFQLGCPGGLPRTWGDGVVTGMCKGPPQQVLRRTCPDGKFFTRLNHNCLCKPGTAKHYLDRIKARAQCRG